jgi:integrase
MGKPRYLTHDGETLRDTEWAERFRLPVKLIRQRLDTLGWDVERALTTPPDPKHGRRGGRPRAGEPRPCPRLRKHKASGQAFTRWRSGGREYTRYFGKWGLPETLTAYRRFSAEWAAGGFQAPTAKARKPLAVSEMLECWLAYCSREYRKRGKETSEPANCRTVARLLNDLYGPTPAADFTPARFRAFRETLVARGLSRPTVNSYADRVVRAFGWATGEGLIPGGISAALREVRHIKPGRTAAPERPKRKPADPAAVAATLAKLRGRPRRVAQIRAAVELQQLTGMRPAEVCEMRPADLERSGDVWVYAVADEWNKNAHRGKPQRYHLGPRAQAVLAPLIEGLEPDSSIFPFDRQGYSLSIKWACRRAGCERWTPHQLRHALASAVAERYQSLERAADAIGDTPATAAKHYVHLDPREQAKREIAREMG